MQHLDPYVETVCSGETGFLISNPVELTNLLDELVANPALRHRIAQNAYNYVRRQRLLHQHITERLDFYNSIRESLLPVQTPPAPQSLEQHGSLVASVLPGLQVAGENYWRLQPTSPAEQCFLEGKNLLDSRKYAEAAAAFAKAAQLAPDYYQAYYFYGRCLWHQGNLIDAEKAYRRAIKYNSSYSRAWQALSEFHTKVANNCARKTADLNPLMVSSQSVENELRVGWTDRFFFCQQSDLYIKNLHFLTVDRNPAICRSWLGCF